MQLPKDDRERMERINGILSEISSMKGSCIVLVEGQNDVAALKNCGVDAEFICVQSSAGGPARAAETVWKSGKCAVILTDWDRRGNMIADSLRTGLMSLGAKYDTRLRSELGALLKPYCADVESIDSVMLMMQRKILG